MCQKKQTRLRLAKEYCRTAESSEQNLSNHEEDPVANKPALLACSLCLPLLLFGMHLQLSHQSVTAEKRIAANSSLEASSDTACPKNTSMEDGEAGAGPPAAGARTSDECSDAIDKCKKPIKYLGSKGLCACFACQYGQTSQHNICTQNKKDKQTLLAESKP